MIIKGNTVGTPMPRSNWNQSDPTKAHYIIGHEAVDAAIAAAQETANNGVTAAGNAQTAADNAQTAADNALTAAGNAQTNAEKEEKAQREGFDVLHVQLKFLGQNQLVYLLQFSNINSEGGLV